MLSQSDDDDEDRGRYRDREREIERRRGETEKQRERREELKKEREREERREGRGRRDEDEDEEASVAWQIGVVAETKRAKAEELITAFAPQLAPLFGRVARELPHASLGTEEPSTLCRWVDQTLATGMQSPATTDDAEEFRALLASIAPSGAGGHEESIIRKAACRISQMDGEDGEAVAARLVVDSLNSQIYRSWTKEMAIETIIENLKFFAIQPAKIDVFKANHLATATHANVVQDEETGQVWVKVLYDELEIHVPLPDGVGQGDEFVVERLPLAVLQVNCAADDSCGPGHTDTGMPAFKYTCVDGDEADWTITSTINDATGLAHHIYERPEGSGGEGWSLTQDTLDYWDTLRAHIEAAKVAHGDDAAWKALGAEGQRAAVVAGM